MRQPACLERHAGCLQTPGKYAIGNAGGNMASGFRNVAPQRQAPSSMVLCHTNSAAEPEAAHTQLGMLLASNGHQGPFQPALQQQQRQHGLALLKRSARLPDGGPDVPVQGQRAEQQTRFAQGACKPAPVRQRPSSSGAAFRQPRQLSRGPPQQQTVAAQRHTERRGQQVPSGRQQAAPSTAGAECRAAATQPAQQAAAGESGGPQVDCECCSAWAASASVRVFNGQVCSSEAAPGRCSGHSVHSR